MDLSAINWTQVALVCGLLCCGGFILSVVLTFVGGAFEVVFGLLSAIGDVLSGARVLDLFAGTGALGLEALSRGAAQCVFVEESAEGRGLIRANIEEFGLQGRARIFRRDATRLGEAGTIAPFGLVFADPPYGKGLAERALRSALAGGWLAADALVVVEEAAASPFQPVEGLELIERREWGDTGVTFAART